MKLEVCIYNFSTAGDTVKKTLMLSMAFLGLANLGTAFAHKQCDPCLQAPKAPCAREGYVFVPEAVIPGQFIPGGQPQTVPAGNFFYRQQGKCKAGRPTIVFLNYLEGSSRAFLCQQAAFSHCYNTIAIDLRGRGNSVKTVPIIRTFIITQTHQWLMTSM